MEEYDEIAGVAMEEDDDVAGVTMQEDDGTAEMAICNCSETVDMAIHDISTSTNTEHNINMYDAKIVMELNATNMHHLANINKEEMLRNGNTHGYNL